MEHENNVIITIAFADATSRNITFRGVEDQSLGYVKLRIKALNREYPSDMAKTFVSAIGAESTMISKAQIVTTEEQVIYSAS